MEYIGVAVYVIGALLVCLPYIISFIRIEHYRYKMKTKGIRVTGKVQKTTYLGENFRPVFEFIINGKKHISGVTSFGATFLTEKHYLHELMPYTFVDYTSKTMVTGQEHNLIVNPDNYYDVMLESELKQRPKDYKSGIMIMIIIVGAFLVGMLVV